MAPRTTPPRELEPFRTGRVGLAVMENAFHHGHMNLLHRMLCDCDRAIVGFGSSQLSGVPGHPFTFSQKREMVEGVFGAGVFSFVELRDIQAVLREDWISYVLGRIRGVGLQDPTDYYAGSRHDAGWYEAAFARIEGPGLSFGPDTVWRDEQGLRSLHVVDRERSELPSGRQVRSLIEARDPEWRRYVPSRLWAYVDANYPPALRVAMRGPELPSSPDGLPVGTLFVVDEEGTRPDGRMTFELMDDRQWRLRRTAADEKAEHARRGHAARTGNRIGQGE